MEHKELVEEAIIKIAEIANENGSNYREDITIIASAYCVLVKGYYEKNMETLGNFEKDIKEGAKTVLLSSIIFIDQMEIEKHETN